jgi:hypothetical protein
MTNADIKEEEEEAYDPLEDDLIKKNPFLIFGFGT